MVKGGYVPGRTHPTDRARGQTTAMPTAVAAARQSYADHPMVRLETAPPGPCHAVSLQETLSGTFTVCATVILVTEHSLGVIRTYPLKTCFRAPCSICQHALTIRLDHQTRPPNHGESRPIMITDETGTLLMPDQLAELRQHLAVSRALKRGEKHHQSNADPHAAMTLQTARSTTHVRRSTVSHSGHKSGHRACRRAIPYSESRVTRDVADQTGTLLIIAVAIIKT